MPAEPPLCLGAHVSARGGVDRAPARGAAIGADCIQVFTRNQRQWHAKPLTDEEVSAFRSARRESRLAPVMSHGSYLINLAAVDAEKLEKSIAGMEAELDRCHRLGVELLNFHPGAHMGAGPRSGIRRIADGLNGICARHPDKRDVTLLLENVAGQGTTLGRSFVQLREILDHLEDPGRFAVCLDTAHAHAAGYDLATESGWEAALAEFEEVLGLQRLAAFHINDSASPFGSRKDRHANLGHGYLGPSAFHRLVTDPRTRGCPMYMETPGGEAAWTREIAWLRQRARGDSVPPPPIPSAAGDGRRSSRQL